MKEKFKYGQISLSDIVITYECLSEQNYRAVVIYKGYGIYYGSVTFSMEWAMQDARLFALNFLKTFDLIEEPE